MIDTDTFVIKKRRLLLGTNIFGVRNVGDTNITIPRDVDSRVIITVKDETGQAGSNNITITVEV